VFLHDDYSAFSYDEATRVIEPISEAVKTSLVNMEVNFICVFYDTVLVKQENIQNREWSNFLFHAFHLIYKPATAAPIIHNKHNYLDHMNFVTSTIALVLVSEGQKSCCA